MLQSTRPVREYYTKEMLFDKYPTLFTAEMRRYEWLHWLEGYGMGR